MMSCEVSYIFCAVVHSELLMVVSELRALIEVDSFHYIFDMP